MKQTKHEVIQNVITQGHTHRETRYKIVPSPTPNKNKKKTIQVAVVTAMEPSAAKQQ